MTSIDLTPEEYLVALRVCPELHENVTTIPIMIVLSDIETLIFQLQQHRDELAKTHKYIEAQSLHHRVEYFKQHLGNLVSNVRVNLFELELMKRFCGRRTDVISDFLRSCHTITEHHSVREKDYLFAEFLKRELDSNKPSDSAKERTTTEQEATSDNIKMLLEYLLTQEEAEAKKRQYLEAHYYAQRASTLKIGVPLTTEEASLL